MSDSQERGNPIQVILIALLLLAGGWYFVRHYDVEGLSIHPKSDADAAGESTLVSYADEFSILPSSSRLPGTDEAGAGIARSRSGEASRKMSAARPPRRPPNLRVASWALAGFGPSKLASDLARRNLVRVVHQFDVVALQQVSSIERDLIPRLVDILNRGGVRYDFVLGPPTGPSDRPEQLAFLFDISRVQIDRTQTYTVADPGDRMAFDPLVAWFRAASVDVKDAWTFSLVNVRIDLAKAPAEVALLPRVFASVRDDGRGEDDVILAGLFQADDAYLLSTLTAASMRGAVRGAPTDIFGRHQTSNLLIDIGPTNEFIGRGGALDFLRVYNLAISEAEATSSQLPVFAEFSCLEGGTW